MALTQAQLRDHTGRIMLQGMANLAREDELYSVNLRTIMSWVKDHKNDSGFSNEADRIEASMRLLRDLFQRTMRRDSEASLLNRRLFRKWLDGHLGYGEGILIESQGQ
jgi:hypothetical protein